jgi:hypothetical protein
MKVIIILISAFFISALGNPSQKKTQNPYVSRYAINSADTSMIAILKFHQYDTDLFKNAKPTDLNKADIKSVDSLAKLAVLKYNRTSKYPIERKLSRYYKQLIAVVNKKGEKLVWLNCMCNVDDGLKWRKGRVIVSDGGTCFFQLKVNLTKKETYDFYVNGIG